MTLSKRIALFAAGVAAIGAGTLAATVKPADAAPMMPIVAASAGHYNWSLADIFGGNHSDRDDRHDGDRDHHDRDNRDRDNRDRGYSHDNGDYRDNGNRDWRNRDNGDRGYSHDDGYRNDGRGHDDGYRGRDNGNRNDGGSHDGGNRDWQSRGGDGHDDHGR